ncbi:radial spoke head 1 homolog isoform X2 [Cydia pomonella]|uniref:radial spoke head 1 homolog isoform X2 n=1 Tax=Cydia pomonella TaxID=82600 RepID=UPI002ADDD20D|nr:radial spoke head 1 homolog isoform X2 [Cydia pomonella]
MTDEVEPEEQKKPMKEIAVVFDEGAFVYETGDTYEGSFEARKKDRFLKMNGLGVYTTAEGDVYTGAWEGDRLFGDDVTITYTDGSKYEGPFKDWSYNDPNGHVWLGRADVGFGRLDPWNHFYQGLERPSEKSQSSQERVVQQN